MKRTIFASIGLAALLPALIIFGQSKDGQSSPPRNLVPVTEAMLKNPSPKDWLMYNRTYDAQRYSPLKQITKTNVGKMKLAWSITQGAGSQEGIPLVHDGIMYTQAPGAAIQAINATNGKVLWTYQRDVPQGQRTQARAKTIAMWEDMIFWTSPDSFVVAVDMRTGEKRWETKTDTRSASQGAVIAGDKVISGGGCGGNHANCYISAHDAKTGKLLWKFFTAANTGEPGGDTWGQTPDDQRFAGTWGLGGTYDPTTNAVIWGVANPTPNTRMARHQGKAMGTSTSAPADLFSDSTIAIDAETGKLKWYYQHLPGDDWDQDWTNDRILATTALNPTPATAKWFNPKIKAGERRDVVLATGEPGGVFALDRKTGEFLWANPWPYDVPNFFLKNVDANGKTFLNEDLIFTGPNQKKMICFYNTRSYWSQAYSPATNSLYVPWTDTCLDMTSGGDGGREVRTGIVRPGSKPDEFSGISKINISTGKIEHIFKGPNPINGAMLLTASDLVFFGDLAQKLRALDATNGKVLWEETLPGPIANSTITYSVNGQQYVAVMTGDGLMTGGVEAYVNLKTPKASNGIYVYALPK